MYKKVFTALFIALISILLAGCGAIKFKPVDDKPCIDRSLYPNSIILDKLDDPCAPYKVLATVVKSGIILDSYTYEYLHSNIVGWINTLELAKSVSAKSIKDIIITELAKVNKKAGIAVFVISDAMLEFSDEEMLKLDDIAILIYALKGLDEEARSISMLME